jgi:PTH2 family peptidyl-tRNA hydrolase
MDSNYQKLVIVLRSDLKNAEGQKIRTGKIIGQAVHAAVDVLMTDTLREVRDEAFDWLSDGLSRVAVLKVGSEAELTDIYNKAVENGFNTALVKDHGLTEFDGVHTLTALSIGPADADLLDRVTGHLSLF